MIFYINFIPKHFFFLFYTNFNGLRFVLTSVLNQFKSFGKQTLKRHMIHHVVTYYTLMKWDKRRLSPTESWRWTEEHRRVSTGLEMRQQLTTQTFGTASPMWGQRSESAFGNLIGANICCVMKVILQSHDQSFHHVCYTHSKRASFPLIDWWWRRRTRRRRQSFTVVTSGQNVPQWHELIKSVLLFLRGGHRNSQKTNSEVLMRRNSPTAGTGLQVFRKQTGRKTMDRGSERLTASWFCTCNYI